MNKLVKLYNDIDEELRYAISVLVFVIFLIQFAVIGFAIAVKFGKFIGAW